MLAMHMANELLTPKVALAFIVITAGVLAYSSWRTSRIFDPAKVPLMGVMGAFVFAAQMINFPILPGTSGHFGGGVLLAILLGPHAATLVMASILIVQCLIFQDGGLLALGTNIFNLGVLPCYLGYGLFSLLAGNRPGARRLYAAVFFSTLIGMVSGAAMVPVQATLSGVAAVPFTKFMAVMVGLHLLVALAEAIITFLVVGYLAKARPQSLGSVAERLSPAGQGLSNRAVVGSLLGVALLLGAVFSNFASNWADALESVTTHEKAGDASLVKPNADPTVTQVSEMQKRTAPLPDYKWTSLSGIVGTVLTLLIVWLIGISLRRNRRKPAASAGPPT
jgi:cobalt/nickel transport system permease protein